MKISAKEGIQQEKLTNDVDDENDLGENVEDDQIVTKTPSTHSAASTRQTVFETDGASCAVLTLTGKISANIQMQQK